MADETQAGFKVGDKVYPFPDGEFTIAEANAIEELSGMSLFDWSTHMEEAAVTKQPPQMRVITAWMFVAMHRDDPRITVRRFLQMGMESWEFVGGDTEDADADPQGLSEKQTSGGNGETGETSGSNSRASSESNTTGEETPTPPALASAG